MAKNLTLNKKISLLATGVLACALVGTAALVTNNASAEESGAVTLSDELAKITTLADLDDSALTFYTANSWAGYGRFAVNDPEHTADHPQVYINGQMCVNVSDYELVHFRGGKDAVHTVGIWDDTANRIASIAYTAPVTGTVTMPATALSVVAANSVATKSETYNGSLGMCIVKGNKVVNPDDSDWTYYEAGQSYTVAEQTFEVIAGESVYIHFYSKKADTSVSNMSFVSFQYDPSFSIEESPLHKFGHAAKINLDANNALVNDVKITDDDATTYPFSYMYRMTGGSTSGFAGREQATQVMEMTRAGVGFDPNQKWLCANETYSAFMPTGQILSVACAPDPNNVILGFTSPYDGALTISNVAFKYNTYPNAKNNYTFLGNHDGKAFKGYAFRVLLNGKQVWPVDSAWDMSLAELYTTATDGYAVGDLIADQKTDDIEDIYVKKYDQIYFEITRADLKSSQNHEVVDFDPIFTIDTSADMSNYVSYTTASDYFDITNTNAAENLLSYWSVDVSEGLYQNAVYELMGDANYATIAYSSGILEDHPTEINWNGFSVSQLKDAALAYRVPATGNLTISGESCFRGDNMALWEYFEIINSGNLIETDGVRIRIEVNGKRVWPTDSAWETYRPIASVNKGVFHFEDVTIGVQEGDQVMIRVNCGEAALYDAFNFNPAFGLKETDSPMQNPPITVQDPEDEPIDTGNSGNENSSTTDNSASNSGSAEPKKKGCISTLTGGVATITMTMGLAFVTLLKKRKE